MTTINPVQTPVTQAPAFKSKKNVVKGLEQLTKNDTIHLNVKKFSFKDVNPYEFCMPKHDKAAMKELAELNFLEQCRAKIDEFLINRIVKKLNKDIKNIELK